MAENTTNINDLPTDPTGGGSISGNVSLVASEATTQIPSSNSSSGISLDQTTISQIVNGLQQASVAGVTSLPSRDIPRNTEGLTHDPQIQPNYVPSPPMHKRDFINEDNEQNFDYKDENTRNTLDSFYDEFQTPILLAVIYFVFQLPVFKKNVFKYVPFLCNSDGNYNVNGLIVVSGLFGFLYYTLSKMMVSFSRF
jgi:hypothetical protein